ncbi:MAG: hypothetical protein HRT66_06890 [Flavobacteriaceae bacterium]|nr:hypothetical protein [Flavobacteriaceae bacterium]
MGPKTEEGWQTSINLDGGQNGEKGEPGKSILSGAVSPNSDQGNIGDFYINTTTNILYGPKSDAGWLMDGVSMKGTIGSVIRKGNEAPHHLENNELAANDGDYYIYNELGDDPTVIISTMYGPYNSAEAGDVDSNWGWGDGIVLTGGLDKDGVIGLGFAEGPHTVDISDEVALNTNKANVPTTNLPADNGKVLIANGDDTYSWKTPSTTTITDDLISTSTAEALSANQGKELKALVDLNVTTASVVNDLTTGGVAVPLSAEQGKELKASITDIGNITGLTSGQITLLSNTSGENTGDQDISGIATNATDISNITGLTSGQITLLSNTSGENTGDQDISGIATNATAIALNTAKKVLITNLSISEVTDEIIIISSDGTDATIPVATEFKSGVMSRALFKEVAANTLKTTDDKLPLAGGILTGDLVFNYGTDEAVETFKVEASTGTITISGMVKNRNYRQSSSSGDASVDFAIDASYNLKVKKVANPIITFSKYNETTTGDYMAKGFITVYYNGSGTVTFEIKPDSNSTPKIYSVEVDEDGSATADAKFVITPSNYGVLVDDPIMFSWYYDGTSFFLGMNVFGGQH